MEVFIIKCEETIVSRGTITGRKFSAEKSFEKLSDAEFYMQKLYKKYNKKMAHQLDEKLKSVNFIDDYLSITIHDGTYRHVHSKLYHIEKEMV